MTLFAHIPVDDRPIDVVAVRMKTGPDVLFDGDQRPRGHSFTVSRRGPWSNLFFISFNVGWIMICSLTIAFLRDQMRILWFPLWFLAVAAVMNGIAHPLLAVASGEPGECLVVPRGVEHRTCADAEAHILCFEPAGVVNTGNLIDQVYTAPGGDSI